MKKAIGIAVVLFWCVGFSESGRAVELPFHGFGEFAVGSRVVENCDKEDDLLLGEARLEIEFNHYTDIAEFGFKTDFTFDGVTDSQDLDVREAFVLLFPVDWGEMKVGRQVLTWGTGDYLFLNDLFPKDWVSFFIGRDDAYLKAPSNAVKVSLFPGPVDIDIVWAPIFEPDRYIDGERLSYFSPAAGGPSGDPVLAGKPEKTLEHGEWALRLSRTVRAVEVALYGYLGRYHQPLGFDAGAGVATFPELAAYGASLRGALLGGIANVEVADYISLDDRDGDDPMVENGQFRGLVGFTREVAKDFTAGVQYYLEWMHHHETYLAGLMNPDFARDEDRHVVTVSLTRLLLMQKLRLTLFAYWSPSDRDAFLRPAAHYKWSDNVSITTGGNIFLGDKEHTFFGQFEDNSNVYARLRYSF